MADDNEYNKFLRSQSVEDIEAKYLSHDITAKVYRKRLRAKARLELSDLAENSSFVSAAVQQSAKNVMEGWKNLTDNIAAKPFDTESNLISATAAKMHGDMKSVLGMMQIAGVLFGSGITDVFGARVENNALKQGYSPGAAHVLGLIMGAGVGGILPVGGINKLIVTGVKASGIAAKVAGTGVQREEAWLRAMAQGLAIDGVDDAASIVYKAAKSAGVAVTPQGIGVPAAATTAAGTQVASAAQSSKASIPNLQALLAQSAPGAAAPAAQAAPAAAAAAPTAAQAAVAAAPAAIAAAPTATLPRALAGAKPFYNYGAKSFKPTFESDVDKALYLVAGKTRSLHDERYMAWLRQQFPDSSDAAIRAMGGSVKDYIKNIARAAESGAKLEVPSGGMEQIKGLSSLARAALAEDATASTQRAFAEAATKLFTGKGIEKLYSKDFTEILTQWDPANVAKGDIQAALKTLAEDIISASPKRLARNIHKVQADYVRNGLSFEYSKEIFINGLLPFAGVAAFFGNSYGTANIILERAMSGHLIQAAYGVKALAWGTSDAVKAAGRVYATGGQRGVIPGWIGRGTRTPTDTMIALDASFKVINMRASLYMDGMASGLTSGQLKAFAANPPLAALEAAAERAYRATYTNDLTGWLGRMSTLARSGPGSYYFTFIKSPIQLTKYGWDRTPGLNMISGRLWHDISKGGTLASDAWARLTMAQLQANMVFELAKDGYITGSGPVGPMRRAWDLVNKPYSLNAKEGMVPIGLLDPFVMPIMLAADFAQIHDQLDEATAAQAAMAVSFSFLQNIGNRTAWQTLSKVVEVVQGRQDAEKWTMRDTRTALAPVITGITGGTLMQRIEGVTDPVQRDARNFIDEIKRRIPGFGQDFAAKELPPVRNGLGNVVFGPAPPGSPWFGFLSPLVPKVHPYTTDPIEKEAARIQATLPYFPDFIGPAAPIDETDPKQVMQPSPPGTPTGVPITGEQRERWQQLYNNIINHDGEDGLKALINSKEYKEAPLQRKRDDFNAAVRSAKKDARENLLLEHPDLAKKLLINKFRSEVGKEDPGVDREELRQSYEEDVREIDIMTPQELEEASKFGVMEPDKPKEQPGFSIMGLPVPPRTYVPKRMEMQNIKVVP